MGVLLVKGHSLKHAEKISLSKCTNRQKLESACLSEVCSTAWKGLPSLMIPKEIQLFPLSYFTAPNPPSAPALPSLHSRLA